jgi:hypothetical protein
MPLLPPLDLNLVSSVFKSSGGGAKKLRGTSTTRKLTDQWTQTGQMVQKTPGKGGAKYCNEVLRCKVPGCRATHAHRVNDDSTLSTISGNISKHYGDKHPELHLAYTHNTAVVVKSDGTNQRTLELPFLQQVKHHVDCVFAIAEDTSALRTKNRDAMSKFVQNLQPGCKLPDERTVKKVLDAITETTPTATPSSWPTASKMVSKILTSTQLQEGLRRHQLLVGIRKRECLVVIKYGATRWASGHLLISRSCTLYHVINRLAQEDLGPDLDMVAALRDADLAPVPGHLDEHRAAVGDHHHVPASDDDDDAESDDDEEEDLRKLSLSDCNLTALQWSHSEIYEGLFNPAREAMTKLQTSKYNTTAIVIPITAALRSFYEGDAFPAGCRQLGNASHKDVRAYNYPTKVFTRKMLPPWAIKCCELIVEQLNALARFLQRKMNKWIYIATVLDPRNKLDKCFTVGDAMNATEVKALYMTELLNVARHHAPEMLVTSDQPPPAAAPRPRPTTSTTARGALDLYNDSSDDDGIPIAHQVRNEQQRIDTRSLAAKESDLFFDLRSWISARNTGKPTAGTIASRSSSSSTKTKRTCTSAPASRHQDALRQG